MVNDPTLIDYEALALHDFRIVLQVTVADNHPSDPKTATATVTVNLVDLDDLTLEPDPASVTTHSLRTEGGEDVCFVGSGFSDLSPVNSGESWGIAATYSDGSNAYTSPLCETRGLAKICCKTAPGIGSSHKWSFQLTLPSSVSGLPVVSRMVKAISFAPTKTTSYETPSIISLKGAVGMGTSGGDMVDLVGRNLGPVGTKGVATYESVSGDLVNEVSCTSVLPTAGASYVVMRCTSQPGFGGPLRWRTVVGGQESQWTPFSDGGNPTSSYAGPEVSLVKPTRGPTVGGYPILITGINFALRGSVSIGSYPAQIIRSNYTHIEAMVRGGMGQNLQVEVKIGNLTSPENDASGVFSYDAPSIHNVSVVSRGVVCDSGVKTSNPTVLHGCTQGGTILMLKGTNFGPACEVSDEATSPDHACACGIRLGRRTDCTIPVETGSWCVPRSWGHSEIRCAVQPGAGGALPVGIVAAGVYFAETNGPTFSYDAPVVHQIMPSVLSVDGGQPVSIIGDNFGPAGTDVTVSPTGYLICDHANTSHKLVLCVTSTGRRGSGIAIRVDVESQQSADTATTNISFFPPKITQVQPYPGQANDPKRITIRGDNFGTSQVTVRVFLNGEKDSCEDARWYPANPPKFLKSHIECQPKSGGKSGNKEITLEFVNDATSTLLYEKGSLVFQDMYTVECSKGEYVSATGCEACPIDENKNPVAFCAGGSAFPVALPGYMQIGNSSESMTPGKVARFTKCSPAKACQGGGVCAVGYVTPDNNCVGCAKQYYKLSGECKPCKDNAGLMLGIYIGVVVIFGIFGLLMVQKGPSVAVTGVGIDYYQVLSIFVGFGIKWPAPVKDVLDAVSISNMNIELVSPQCTIDFSYDQKWLAIEFAPLGLALLALIGYGVLLLKKVVGRCVWRTAGLKGGKKREHGNMHRHANAIIGAIILMIQFIYIYCTKTAFEIFACETKENGKSYMYFEPEIECWTGTHTKLWPLALFFASLYGVGIPIIFTIIVIRNRTVIKHDQVLRVLGTGSSRAENPEHYEFRKRYYKLYYRFKPRYHYWGEVILFRKFLIVLVTVFLRPNPTLQATCAVMILFVSYSVHTRTMPYLRNDLMGCENIDGLDDEEEDAALLDEGEARKQRMQRAKDTALEMVDKNPEAASVRNSAKKIVKKIPSSSKQKSGGRGAAMRRTQSMDNPHPEQSFERSERTHTASSLKANTEQCGVELTDLSAAGIGGVSVTIVEEGEEKGTNGTAAGVVATANSPGSTDADIKPLVTTRNGRAAPHRTDRPPTTKAGMSKEKSRRLSALIHMGEGNSLLGQAGNATDLWSSVRSHFVTGNATTPMTSMYGVASAGGVDAASIAASGGRGSSFMIPQKGGSFMIASGMNMLGEEEQPGNTFTEKLYVSKNFLMDYNTMETVSDESSS